MLASVSLASPRERPMVRIESPKWVFWWGKICSIAALTEDFVASARATWWCIGLPAGFRRWMRLVSIFAASQRSLLWER